MLPGKFFYNYCSRHVYTLVKENIVSQLRRGNLTPGSSVKQDKRNEKKNCREGVSSLVLSAKPRGEKQVRLWPMFTSYYAHSYCAHWVADIFKNMFSKLWMGGCSLPRWTLRRKTGEAFTYVYNFSCLHRRFMFVFIQSFSSMTTQSSLHYSLPFTYSHTHSSSASISSTLFFFFWERQLGVQHQGHEGPMYKRWRELILQIWLGVGAGLQASTWDCPLLLTKEHCKW